MGLLAYLLAASTLDLRDRLGSSIIELGDGNDVVTMDIVVGTVAALGSIISGLMIWIVLRAVKGRHRKIIHRCRPAVGRRDPGIPQGGKSFAGTYSVNGPGSRSDLL